MILGLAFNLADPVDPDPSWRVAPPLPALAASPPGAATSIPSESHAGDAVTGRRRILSTAKQMDVETRSAHRRKCMRARACVCVLFACVRVRV